MTEPERLTLPGGLAVRRIVVGLWQVADQERFGRTLDLDAAAEALAAYGRAGFDTWDMADHYGSAEIIAGRAAKILAAEGRSAPTIMTKWVPEPGPMTAPLVRAAVERALTRLDASRIDLMQLHWWRYDHPGYLEAMQELAKLREEGLIGHLGLTNFDAAHLRLLVRHGIEVATNQVSFSLIDRRAAGPMSGVCAETGARVLAFGTLAGGFFSHRWLGVPTPDAVADWSKLKYGRFIETVGGWSRFQTLLAALDAVARRHDVAIASVATRWVLDHPAVAGAIVGVRLTEREHREGSLETLALDLSAEDRAAIDAAADQLSAPPGDCGDEYRMPPFLTASGDLSHHLADIPNAFRATPLPAHPSRQRVSTGSIWEEKAGFSRAVRVGERILVSGTTATAPDGATVAPGDPEAQAVYILDKIAASLAPLGAGLDDVVRTRIYIADPDDWEAVSRAHARAFARALPANTLVSARLIGPYLVEIEAEAVVPGTELARPGAQPR